MVLSFVILIGHGLTWNIAVRTAPSSISLTEPKSKLDACRANCCSDAGKIATRLANVHNSRFCASLKHAQVVTVKSKWLKHF